MLIDGAANGLAGVLRGERKCGSVCRREEGGLVMATVPPAWADGVNDMTGAEPSGAGDHGRAGRAPRVALAELAEQLRAGSPVDRTVNAATAGE